VRHLALQIQLQHKRGIRCGLAMTRRAEAGGDKLRPYRFNIINARLPRGLAVTS
jgi:hypothetical protein